MSFGALNYAILGLYLLGMLGIGLRFAGRQRTREDYFLAGRRMPWLPVAMSMFASLTSAVTFMGLPAAAYRENVSLLVVCLVSPLLAPVLVWGIYPVYRRLNVTTSYEYVGVRFGPAARRFTAGLFVLARLGWMGTVIYAPALALSVAAGVPLKTGILLMGLLATSYTVLGGLQAVLWTDVAQYVILVGGAVWAGVELVGAVPGGAAGILRAAREAGHLRAGSLGWDVTRMTAGAAALSFFLSMLQDYGTDQVSVQRLLAIRRRSGLARAVAFNAVTDVVMVALLLFLGLALLAYYRLVAPAPAGIGADQMLPYFVMHALPPGVSGLIISAIFAAAMSSMDSGINSLATVIENDLIERDPARVDERAAVRRARWLTLGLGLVSTALAFLAARIGSIIEGFAVFMSLFNAPVLALFLLGLLSRRAGFGGWLAGVAVTQPATQWLQHVARVHRVY